MNPAVYSTLTEKDGRSPSGILSSDPPICPASDVAAWDAKEADAFTAVRATLQ